MLLWTTLILIEKSTNLLKKSNCTKREMKFTKIFRKNLIIWYVLVSTWRVVLMYRNWYREWVCCTGRILVIVWSRRVVRVFLRLFLRIRNVSLILYMLLKDSIPGWSSILRTMSLIFNFPILLLKFWKISKKNKNSVIRLSWTTHKWALSGPCTCLSSNIDSNRRLKTTILTYKIKWRNNRNKYINNNRLKLLDWIWANSTLWKKFKKIKSSIKNRHLLIERKFWKIWSKKNSSKVRNWEIRRKSLKWLPGWWTGRWFKRMRSLNCSLMKKSLREILSKFWKKSSTKRNFALNNSILLKKLNFLEKNLSLFLKSKKKRFLEFWSLFMLRIVRKKRQLISWLGKINQKFLIFFLIPINCRKSSKRNFN